MGNTDNTLPESSQIFLAVLDKISATAIHAADPRQPVKDLAAAFAVYLRTPDEPETLTDSTSPATV
jgi:hypothetical protein